MDPPLLPPFTIPGTGARRRPGRERRAAKAAIMPDPRAKLLTLPIRGVFALQVRADEQALLVRLVGFHDDEEVTETHTPPLPQVVEVNRPPWRLVSHNERRLT